LGRGHQLGLTLIEVAVALAVAGLVALAIFGLFRIGVALHQRSAQTIAAGEAAIALDSIARTLRETSRDPDAFRVWPTQPDTERAETVAIRTARASGGFVVGEEGTPQWVVGWIGFAYDPSRRAVIRADFPEGNEVPPPPWTGRVVARQARAFNVQRDGDRFVITLVLEGGDSTLTLTTTVWPRNR
jgi:prepilin-type N-terminal cleavage/methylation domain-containing protein